MNPEPSPVSPDTRRPRRVAALVLAVLAVLGLASTHLSLSSRGGLLLPLGVGFIVWAALARVSGLLVPGGILTGLGAGLALQPAYGREALLLGMAAGFGLVALLSAAMFGREKGWYWPLFPAGGLALSAFLTVTGPDVRDWVRHAVQGWPYAALAVALWLFLAPPGRKA